MFEQKLSGSTTKQIKIMLFISVREKLHEVKLNVYDSMMLLLPLHTMICRKNII